MPRPDQFCAEVNIGLKQSLGGIGKRPSLGADLGPEDHRAQWR